MYECKISVMLKICFLLFQAKNKRSEALDAQTRNEHESVHVWV